MDTLAYLNRIGIRPPCSPDLETLRALHRAHLNYVPFENLDIHRGLAIRLDRQAFYAKIVSHRRGGFCYELNGLFSGLLESLGYAVTLLSASDARSDGTFGPEFDHLTLLVRIPGSATPWLADVGWGDTFREPLRLDETGEQTQDGRAYWFERDGAAYLLYQRDEIGAVERQYRFDLQPYSLDDFVGMCAYHQQNPESAFVRGRIVTRATADGRVTLADMRLIQTAAGQRSERLLSSDQEYRSALEEHFGIVLA